MSLNPLSLGNDLISHLREKKSHNIKNKSQANKFRVRFLGWISFCVFFTLVFQLLSISFPKTISFSLFSKTKTIAQKQFISRSDLLDRNGEILATNVPIYHFAIRPKNIKKKNKFIDKIMNLMPDFSQEKLYKKVHSKKSFVYVKKKISKNLQKKLASLKNKNIELEKINQRAYPKKQILSHLVGFTDIDNKGLKGLERGLDSEISKDRSSIM